MNTKTHDDFEQRRNKQTLQVRSVLDYTVGIVIIAIGIVMISKFRHDTISVVFGVLSILYGIWRLYKGYRKKFL